MKYIFSFLLLFTGLWVAAQRSLSGQITDQETNEPLVGATVKRLNAKEAVLTNRNGKFSLQSISVIDAIEISFVGYETQQLRVPANTKFVAVSMASSDVNLSTVTVTGYENNRRLLETAGSIALLKSKEMQRGDNMDIMPAINTIPGVKMEAYAAGNYRISIRGSLVNNPWGIRNVKIYWNDIPLSSPDGTAQKNIDFDPALIGTLEVLKGPSGSIYGAGNGGVLLIKNTKGGPAENSLEAGYTRGSYGYGRFQTTYKTAGNNFNLTANVVSQRYAGYRDNNWGNKDVINLFSQFFPSEKRSLNFFITHVTGSLGIAGGLTKAQADSAPSQAVPYNKDNKISVKRYDATVLGASQTYRFSDSFSNTTSVYGNFQTYDHPFGSGVFYNGFFKESMIGYGGRTKFVYSPTLRSIKARFSLGGEYQYQHQLGNTFTIINDQPGTWPEAGNLYQNDIVASTSKMLFAQAEFDLTARIFLTLGASYTNLSYDISDLYRDSTHVNYSELLKFPAKISPRIGLVKELCKSAAVHGSAGFGYSPPPVWELNNYDGTLNKEIKPEDGVNYEMGVRGTILKSKLNFDVTAYQMHLKNAIVPVAQANGTTAYRNAGLTNQKGVEAMLSFIAVNEKTKPVSFLKLWVSYTYNNYVFKDYKTQSFDWTTFSVKTVDNSGKHVTGVVPNCLSAGIDLETKYGFYFNTLFYHYDKTPLNDGNTYYADAYSLLNLKFGFRKKINRIGFDIFTGVNNAMDTQYSSLLLYNADATSFGAPPPFYNPSAGVNYYGGMKIKYSFK